jgi:hypothetical protein
VKRHELLSRIIADYAEYVKISDSSKALNSEIADSQSMNILYRRNVGDSYLIACNEDRTANRNFIMQNLCCGSCPFPSAKSSNRDRDQSPDDPDHMHIDHDDHDHAYDNHNKCLKIIDFADIHCGLTSNANTIINIKLV